MRLLRPNVEKLSRQGNIRGLVKALQDEETEIRISAANALGALRDERAIEPLLNTLEDEKISVCREAAKALAEIGTSATIPLTEVLKSASRWETRDAAAHALIVIGKLTSNVDLLGLVIRSSVGSHTREAAAQSLVALGEVSTDTFVNLLRDSELRKLAANALQKLDWQPTGDWNGAVYFIEFQEWDNCVQIGAPAVQPLTYVLCHSVKSNKEASEALVAIGQPATPQLLSSLHGAGLVGNPNRELVLQTLDRLGWIPTDDVDSAWYWIARGDFEKCSAMGSVAIKPLIDYLKFTKYKSSISHGTGIGEAIRRIGFPAVEPLLAFFYEDSKRFGLGPMGRFAIGVISDIGDEQALLRLLSYEDKHVREYVANVLRHTGRCPKDEVLAATYWIAGEEWQQCVSIGSPALGPLIGALQGEGSPEKYLKIYSVISSIIETNGIPESLVQWYVDCASTHLQQLYSRTHYITEERTDIGGSSTAIWVTETTSTVVIGTEPDPDIASIERLIALIPETLQARVKAMSGLRDSYF